MTPRAAGPRPPAAWLAIARAMRRAHRRDEIEGDLLELWHLRRDDGWARAAIGFWRDAWSLRARRAPGRAADPVNRRAGVSAMLQDLRYAWRLITRQPAFALLAVLTLTLGIAAATAIFTICDRVLLRPLPYADPDRIVALSSRAVGIAHGPTGVTIWPPDAAGLREFTGLGIYDVGGLNLGEAAAPIRLRAAAATSGFFAALGVAPLIGRTFDPADDRMSRVAILSYDTWRQNFGADRAVLNRAIQLNSQSFTVIGVMPRGVTFPDKTQVWVPPYSDGQMTGSAFIGKVLGRLADGVSIPQAVAALKRAGEAARPGEGGSMTPADLTPLPELLVTGVRPRLLFLAVIVGLLLAATCANVAGLLLSRLRVRQRELLVRTALGASRRRLVQQLVTECAVLTAAGAIAGFALAVWAVRSFAATVPTFAPDADLGGIDVRFFLVGATVAALSGLLFSLGPALSASRAPIASVLREGATSTRRARWFGGALVASQVAAALVLLVATTAALTAVVRLTRVDLGFGNDRAVVFELTLPESRYGRPAAARAFLDQLRDHLRVAPGAARIGMTTFAPGGNQVMLASALALAGDAADPPVSSGPGAKPAAPSRPPLAVLLAATPDYFSALGIPLLAGRFFTDDDRAGAPRVVILSDAAARKLTPNVASLIGKRLAGSRRDPVGAEIVGVVGGVRLRGVGGDAPAQLYQPMAQAEIQGSLAVAIDGSGDLDAVVASARQALREVDPELPIYNVNRVKDLRARFLATERLTLTLTGAFSVTALLLCAIGLYGALAQLVAQRTREIGIRMALGADRTRLRWSVVLTGLRLASAGVVGGALAAGVALRLAARFIPQLDPPAVATIAVSALVLIGVALLAAWVPARRASGIDPARALRGE